VRIKQKSKLLFVHNENKLKLF